MTKLRKFSESLPMLLLKARENAMTRFRPMLRGYGLTEQQWRVLRALEDLGSMTAARLSRECAILAPSMTRIVRRLSDARLITTRRSESDLRRVDVSISARGKKIVAEIGPSMEAQYAIIRDKLTVEEYAALTRALKRLITMDD